MKWLIGLVVTLTIGWMAFTWWLICMVRRVDAEDQAMAEMIDAMIKANRRQSPSED